MSCERFTLSEKRGDLLALIDGEEGLSFEKREQVVIFERPNLIEIKLPELPALKDARELQSRVWQFRRASYS